jgi:2-aminoadipate transaminase
MQDALSPDSNSNTISFALGLPAPELFPLQALEESTKAVLRDGGHTLQYGPPDAQLRSQIVELMADRGVVCTEDQIFLTAGAQQGLLLLGRLFFQTGCRVAVEQVVYPGFRQVAESCGAKLVPIPIQPRLGPDLAAMQAVFGGQCRTAVYYTVPEGHNPLGTSIDISVCEAICNLANEFRILVIEDDPYGLLKYDREIRRPLCAYSNHNILYVGSFSKIIAPGLRVGWLVVPPSLVPALSVAKESTDINTVTISQRIVSHFIASGNLPSQLEQIRTTYELRRDTMVTALNEHMPPGCHYSIPRSGFFIWVELPDGSDATVFLRAAAKEGVLALPGDCFAVHRDTHTRRSMRLNFSSNPPDIIRDGIRRLAKVLRQEMAAA